MTSVLFLTICLILASIVTVPVIFYEVFAIPSAVTLANPIQTSAGKCSFENDASAYLTPHYALVEPNRPNIFVTGGVWETHVSNEDVYFDHYSHDNTFKVILDDKFYDLNSRSNNKFKFNNEPNNQTGKDKLLMEMELEIGTANDGRTDRFPIQFWPFRGDRLSMEGRYIFDCGHPPPRTEIHPPSSMAFTRIQPMIFKSIGNDPLLASQTSIFINGAGGVFTPNLKRLINPDTSLLNLKTRAALELCKIFTLGKVCSDKDFVAAALIKEYQLRASGGDINVNVRKIHEFEIPLPVKPSASSRLVTQIDTSLGGPAPKIEGPFQSDDGKPFIKVTVDLTSPAFCKTCTAYGSHIASAWADPPQPNKYHHLKIAVQRIALGPSILARQAMSGAETPYDFKNLWLGVNGQYKELLGPTMGEFQDTRPKIFNPPVTFDVIVAEQGGRSLAGSLNIKSTGYVRSEADNCFQPDKGSKCGDLFLYRIKDSWEEINARQEIESMIRHWDNGSNFGIGTHSSECSLTSLQNSPKCEFMLTYTISESSPATVVLPVSPTPIPAPLPTPTPIPIPTPTPTPSPTPTPTCDPKSETLKKGARGAIVIELQRDLTQLGYGALLGKFGPSGDGIDGIFGDNTKRAVIKFQQDRQLKKIDGIVGPETWGAICASINSMIPQKTFETVPKLSYVSFEGQTEPQQPTTNLSQPSSTFSTDPGSDLSLIPTEEEVEGSEESELGKLFQSMNTSQGLPLEGNLSSGFINMSAKNATLSPLEAPLSFGQEELADNKTFLNETVIEPIISRSNITANETSLVAPEQIVCSDGTPPDPTTGLCADGLQPQPQSQALNATAGDLATQQLVCSDGTEPDVITGLCADGSQP